VIAGVRLLFALPQLGLFMWKHGKPSKYFHVYEALSDELKKSHGIKSVGIAGYCYGGGVCLDLGTKPDKIAAFAVAHSQVKVPDSLSHLVKPGLFISADNDWQLLERKQRSTSKQSRLDSMLSTSIQEHTMVSQ
jgi:dienelactone hydrolase